MSQSLREENIKGNRPVVKCRIPQRLGSGKHRPLSKSKEQRQISSEYYTNLEKHSPERASNELDLTKIQTFNPLELKNDWKLKRGQYEQMRSDLNEKQGTIMKVYAALKTAEEKLALMGHKISSSIVDDDLRIMNVAKLTPYQLLQLCEETKACSGDSPGKEDLVATYIDMETMYNIPPKVFATFEDALKMSNEFINCLQSLIENEKDSSHSENGKKINDFKAKYDTLNTRVQGLKKELDTDLRRITDVIRKCVNETIVDGTIRNKDLSHEVSETNSRNSSRQKQINNKDNVFKLHTNKTKIEELERRLKEEKLKNATAKERLKKLENEAKMNENHATRLEVALDQARVENGVLERTIQNQKDQNEQSQKDFNEELCKLTDSIKENSKNLAKIAEAKKTLQNEKEELEKRLDNLSNMSSKTISNLRIEIKGYTRKIVEIEKKYKKELDEKARLQSTIQSQQFQLAKRDERHQETLKLLRDAETKLSESLKYRNNAVEEATVAAEDLEDTKKEIISLNKKIIEQNVLIEKMQKEMELTKMLEGDLRSEINEKIRHIEDQHNKYLLIEDKTKESELKLRCYEEQIVTLNECINNFKHRYGEGENSNEVNSTITKQNQKIQELNQRNDELTRAIKSQTEDLKACMQTISAQELLIKEKDALLSELTEKENKQMNVIECLQRSLALKTHKTDDEITVAKGEIIEKVNRKLIEKDSEIKSLKVDIGRKEKRISQMEKVMIALYEQHRKTKLKNKKYREKNSLLKQVLSEYETYADAMNSDSPMHFDRLIQILENEMEPAKFCTSGRHGLFI